MTPEKRAEIVALLVEGMSMRAISRATGVARRTIDELLGDLGTACANYQDRTLVNLETARVEADEIWSFCYAKQEMSLTSFRARAAMATCDVDSD